jgi:hypothetical protein
LRNSQERVCEKWVPHLLTNGEGVLSWQPGSIRYYGGHAAGPPRQYAVAVAGSQHYAKFRDLWRRRVADVRCPTFSGTANSAAARSHKVPSKQARPLTRPRALHLRCPNLRQNNLDENSRDKNAIQNGAGVIVHASSPRSVHSYWRRVFTIAIATSSFLPQKSSQFPQQRRNLTSLSQFNHGGANQELS